MIDGLDGVLSASRELGLIELRSALAEVLDGARVVGRLTREHNFAHSWKRHKAYRLGFEINGQARSLVVKRLNPARAQRNQLVATRWLPAVGLGQCGPALFGVAAERSGQYVWHVYEDLGDQVLDVAHPEPARVESAVDLIAGLHVRFAEHPLLAEGRMYGRDLGMGYYIANIRDAMRGLESLQPPAIDLDTEHLALRDRLLQRLHKHLGEAPDRARVISELGGGETLLHGDLWPENILAVPSQNGLESRLIDWDAMGVGPLTYDLSTFLYRFPARDRPWILDRYQEAVAPLGWRVPVARDLNLMLETAEISRLANCLIWPCMVVESQPAWTFERLAEVEEWFDAVEPAVWPA